tara:strand:- start:180 stop:419 length:240 start_codon:yes stop_codon:yes gene_type:complete
MQFFKKILNKLHLILGPIGRFLGKFLSPFSLLIVYIFIVIPTSIFLKIFKKDVLKIKMNSRKKTYWIERKENPNFEEQF